MTLAAPIAAALAPFAPADSSVHKDAIRLNDDDLYVVDLRSKCVIRSIGCKSQEAWDARFDGIRVRPGQALVTGMQARFMGLED